jgi:serine kinase of HPr protein (carbohydrate metabolism regulator)
MVHATCVAIGGRGVLLLGVSGAGKSDLALRLIDRGARLVSDDYTLVDVQDGRLSGRAPPAIAGMMEIRGVGLVEVESAGDVPIALLVDLDRLPERLPEEGERTLVAGVPIPVVGLAALEPSAPIKVEYALRQFGLVSETRA